MYDEMPKRIRDVLKDVLHEYDDTVSIYYEFDFAGRDYHRDIQAELRAEERDDHLFWFGKYAPVSDVLRNKR